MNSLTKYADLVQAAVVEGVRDSLNGGQLTAPLINALARVLVGIAHVSNTDLDDVVEIARNELDEAVTHYDKVLPRPAE